MKLHRAPHEAIVVQGGGPIYEGQAGQTRTERVHLVELDGSVRSVELYRVVNVATHPELKPRVLAGQLHRLEDGRDLALPFVYHDPNARKFALVIPPALAHLEMKEWARLMAEVADDTRHPVPPYVREGTTVLGLGALELFLEAGVEPEDSELQEVPPSQHPRSLDLQVREQALNERERALREREKEAQAQEQALIRMASDLAAQEAALRRREQQLATARADLDAREAELGELRARALAAAHEAAVVPDGEWSEVRAAEAAELDSDAATVVANLADVNGQPAEPVDDSELEDVAAPKSRAPARRSGALAAVAEPIRMPAPPPLPRRGRSERPAPNPNALSAAAARLAQPPPLTQRADATRLRTEPPPPLGRLSSMPPPQIDPPPGWHAVPALGMVTHIERGELTMFVKLDAARRSAFDEEAELLLQYVEPGGHPVVVLSLAGAGGAVSRAALDGVAQDTQLLLGRLERVFRATLVLFEGNELHATRPVLAPREANARAIVERLSRPRSAPTVTAAQAVERALSDPPPVRDERLPFGPPRPQPATTASVAAAMNKLEQWIQPDKLEEALVLHSVPKHVIDASCRRVLRAAIGFGLALPPRLAELAVEHKLADSRAQLVREQLEGFKQRIERQQNDLDAAATLRNWEKLFAQADQADVEIPRELREFVERSSASSGGRGAELPLSSAELRRDLGDPGRRMDAIRELGRRGHPSAVAPIVSVLEELSPEEVASAVVVLLGFGAHAADGLVQGLSAPSQHVRHACALGLGQLKLPYTVAALLRQVQHEPTPSWTEMARALGDFGPIALPAVADALRVTDRRERLMVGLAHLANHGCGEEVKNLESDPDPGVALAARQAIVRRARMENEDIAVRTQQRLRDNSPEARFSQVFFAEVARTAS